MDGGKAPEPSFFKKYVEEPLYGPAEALTSLGTGMVGGAVAPLYGVGKSIAAGKYGTPQGVKMAEEQAAKAQEALTYQPRTKTGQAILGGVGSLGRAIGADNLAVLTPLTPELSALRAPPGAMRAATQPLRKAADVTTQPVRAAAGKVGEMVSPKVEPVGDPSGFTSIGQKVQQKVSGAESRALQSRANEADALYTQARDTARALQTEEPFSESIAGKRLFDELQREKGFSEGGKKFEVGADKVQAIDRLLSALTPKVSGGERQLQGLQQFGPTKKTTTYKDVDAVIEELRSLREAYKPGAPKEGYAALESGYRKHLEEMLTQALYDWAPAYEKADQAYREASINLRPFKTQLMQRLLKKEKFSPQELISDTEKFAQEFFDTADTVKQLKSAIKDDVFVKDIASDYFATVVGNKSPEAIRNFVADPKNQGWMQESGILDAAQRFAKQTTKAERADDIKRIIKRGLIGGAAAGLGIKGVGTMLGGM